MHVTIYSLVAALGALSSFSLWRFRPSSAPEAQSGSHTERVPGIVRCWTVLLGLAQDEIWVLIAYECFSQVIPTGPFWMYRAFVCVAILRIIVALVSPTSVCLAPRC